MMHRGEGIEILCKVYFYVLWWVVLYIILGLVSRLFNDQTECLQACLSIASYIAAKSPIAVQGTKINLNYSRDHTIAESLEYMVSWNMVNYENKKSTKEET